MEIRLLYAEEEETRPITNSKRIVFDVKKVLMLYSENIRYQDHYLLRQGEFDENDGLQGGGCATFSLRPALHLLGSLDWEHLLSSASA